MDFLRSFHQKFKLQMARIELNTRDAVSTLLDKYVLAATQMTNTAAAPYTRSGTSETLGCLKWKTFEGILLQNVKVHTPLPATASDETEVKP